MSFIQLNKFAEFTIEGEPQSVFYKEGNNYDGSINAYRIKSKYKENELKPVIFSRGHKVQKIN